MLSHVLCSKATCSSARDWELLSLSLLHLRLAEATTSHCRSRTRRVFRTLMRFSRRVTPSWLPVVILVLRSPWRRSPLHRRWWSPSVTLLASPSSLPRRCLTGAHPCSLYVMMSIHMYTHTPMSRRCLSGAQASVCWYAQTLSSEYTRFTRNACVSCMNTYLHIHNRHTLTRTCMQYDLQPPPHPCRDNRRCQRRFWRFRLRYAFRRDGNIAFCMMYLMQYIIQLPRMCSPFRRLCDTWWSCWGMHL